MKLIVENQNYEKIINLFVANVRFCYDGSGSKSRNGVWQTFGIKMKGENILCNTKIIFILL
jgi:hypothetical protein